MFISEFSKQQIYVKEIKNKGEGKVRGTTKIVITVETWRAVNSLGIKMKSLQATILINTKAPVIHFSRQTK